MVKTEIDFNKKKFKKRGGEDIDNIIDYIKEKVDIGQDVRIMVGCDSKQKRRMTLYSLVIVLYDEELNKGAHVLYMKMRTPKERDIFMRMMNEAVYSLNLSLWLDEMLDGIYNKPNFTVNEYDGSIPTRKIEVHVDINPLEGNMKQNKSNVAYSAAMGMLCGSGFRVRAKPIASAASCAADYLVQ